jgi:hypothetical protein
MNRPAPLKDLRPLHRLCGLTRGTNRLQITITDMFTEENRDQMQLFVDIAKYMSQHMSGKRASEDDANQGSDAKKRKMQPNASPAVSAPQALNSTATLNQKDVTNILYSAPDTSFAVPQRKKMTVQLAADPQRLEEGAIRVVHEASGVNLAVPFSKIGRDHSRPSDNYGERRANNHNRASLLSTCTRESDATVELRRLCQPNSRSQDR